jgi:hypothetical protein
VGSGRFSSIDGSAANNAMAFDGQTWSPMDGGVSSSIGSIPVFGQTVVDPDGPGPRPAVLVIGGAFAAAGGRPSALLARWGCPACYADCDASGPPLNIHDFMCFINRYAAGDPYANCDGSTTPPVLNVQDFACFLHEFAAGCT